MQFHKSINDRAHSPAQPLHTEPLLSYAERQIVMEANQMAADKYAALTRRPTSSKSHRKSHQLALATASTIDRHGTAWPAKHLKPDTPSHLNHHQQPADVMEASQFTAEEQARVLARLNQFTSSVRDVGGTDHTTQFTCAGISIN